MKILSEKDFVAGNFPSRGIFKSALKIFEMTEILPNIGKSVVGAFPYGSIIRGDYGFASDIDYFVLFSDDRIQKDLRMMVDYVYQETKVPIQLLALNVEDAQNGYHTINNFFRSHLNLAVLQNGYYGENPLEILFEEEVNPKEDLRKSLSLHTSLLRKGYFRGNSSSEKYVSFLEDIMGKPFHVMRDILNFMNPELFLKGNFKDTKGNILKEYSKLDVDSSLIQYAENLGKISRTYFDLLNLRRKEDHSEEFWREGYFQITNEMFGCYEDSLKFIRANSKFISKK